MIINASSSTPVTNRNQFNNTPRTHALPHVVRLTNRLFIFPHRKVVTSTAGGHWLDELATWLPAQAYGIVAHDGMLLVDAVWPDTLAAALHTCATHSLTLAGLVVSHTHFLPITHPAWRAQLAQHRPPLLALPSVAATANAHPLHTMARFDNLRTAMPHLAHEFGLRMLCWEGHSGADALLLWDAGDDDAGRVLFPGDCAMGPALGGRVGPAALYGSEGFFRHTSAHFTRCALRWFPGGLAHVGWHVLLGRPPFFLSDNDGLLRREWQQAWPDVCEGLRGMMPFHGVPLLAEDATTLAEAASPLRARQLVLM